MAVADLATDLALDTSAASVYVANSLVAPPRNGLARVFNRPHGAGDHPPRVRSAFARLNPAQEIDGARAIPNGELAEKRRDVTAGGRGGDAESVCHLAGRDAVGKEFQDLPLAVGERCARAGGEGRTTRIESTQRIQDLLRVPPRQRDLACGNRPEDIREPFRAGVATEVSNRAGHHNGDKLVASRSGGDDDEACTRNLAGDAPDRLQTATRQLGRHEAELGPLGVSERHGGV